jgi:hypothetical protein
MSGNMPFLFTKLLILPVTGSVRGGLAVHTVAEVITGFTDWYYICFSRVG